MFRTNSNKEEGKKDNKKKGGKAWQDDNVVEEVTIVPSGKTKKRETNNTWHQCASYIVTYRKQQNQNKERSGDQKNRKSELINPG